MRRKPGSLVPLEEQICVSAADLRRAGTDEFHGYEIAKHVATRSSRRSLTAYGTLYRALGRLENMGLLRSRWEDPYAAAAESRPVRRLYTLTADGETAAARVRHASTGRSRRPRKRRLAPA
jgi:DNA-binding PadR family transcriptional regulator